MFQTTNQLISMASMEKPWKTMENPMIYGPNFIMMNSSHSLTCKKNSKRGRRDDSPQKFQDQIHPDIFGHDMLCIIYIIIFIYTYIHNYVYLYIYVYICTDIGKYIIYFSADILLWLNTPIARASICTVETLEGRVG